MWLLETLKMVTCAVFLSPIGEIFKRQDIDAVLGLQYRSMRINDDPAAQPLEPGNRSQAPAPSVRKGAAGLCLDGDQISAFDDQKIIEGQGTVALEILKDCKEPLDYLLVPVGGGGLISGLISVIKQTSPETKIIAVEPEGAPSLKTSLTKGVNTTLNEIEKFVWLFNLLQQKM